MKVLRVRLFVPLKVSAPFHSRYMRDAEREFGAVLETGTFEPPAVTVIANVTAAPYETDKLRETLASQIGHSVRWLDTMVYLMRQGVTTFEEVGPGNVLTKLAAQIKGGV